MSRRHWASAAAVVLTSALVAPAQAAAEPTSEHADLGMAHLSDLYVATTTDGRELLRFSAMIVNVGSGPFEIVASRADQLSSFDVMQRISQSDGSTTDVPTDAELVYGGDGHDHWHVRDLEKYELLRLDNGVKVGTGAKSGFCFFDTDPYELSLPGAPSDPVYSHETCGHLDSLDVSMGLSIGWGDEYPWNLPDQYIEITSVDNGKYRLRATADQGELFTEASESNNVTWVDIRLSRRGGRTSVKILDYGPDALSSGDDGGSGGDDDGGGQGNGNGNGVGNGGTPPGHE